MINRLVNRIFAKKKESLSLIDRVITPEETAVNEKRERDLMFEKMKSLSNLINSENTGWKEVSNMIEQRIEDSLKSKMNLDSRNSEHLLVMQEIDKEIDAMRRFIQIPSYFINSVENRFKDV